MIRISTEKAKKAEELLKLRNMMKKKKEKYRYEVSGLLNNTIF